MIVLCIISVWWPDPYWRYYSRSLSVVEGLTFLSVGDALKCFKFFISAVRIFFSVFEVGVP